MSPGLLFFSKNSKYLTCSNATTSLRATSTTIGNNQHFTLESRGAGEFCIKARNTGNYVRIGEDNKLYADQVSNGVASRFVWVR
jgi:hypothetical protein